MISKLGRQEVMIFVHKKYLGYWKFAIAMLQYPKRYNLRLLKLLIS